MILAGNGSDDILTIATRTFVPPGGTLAYPDPTYSLYPVLARARGGEGRVTVPWEKDWSLPIDALLATKADAIYLANPNAPTRHVRLAAEGRGAGARVRRAGADRRGVRRLRRRQLPAAACSEYENVVITRTLSKAYSLAGLRFGYAVAQPR